MNIDAYTKDEKIFKEYVLRQYIGDGSYGRVYLVENKVGVFALKILYKDVKMEMRGVESVMKIRSNRLISILDYGKTLSNEDCILMEYIPCNLERILADGRLEEPKARHYFTEILKGLEVLHKNNILHRDIKPENLFVLEDIVKIGDFGTARYISEEKFGRTISVGTPHYMAPECFGDNYGFSVDCWSAAVIFYRMLTGRFVFDGKFYEKIFAAIIRAEPNLICVPDNYRPFFKKCFEKDVKKRYMNPEEILKEIQQISEGGNKEIPAIPVHVRETHEQHSASQEKASVQENRPREKTYQLRHTAILVPNDAYAYKLFGLDERLRPLSYIKNDFRDNGDGTVTDSATELVWQKSGSETYIVFPEAQEYIKQMNAERFGGNKGWRLPTVEEFISLLEPEKQSNDLHISPIFHKKQCWCWTADRRSPVSGWHVNFDRGYFHHYEDRCYVRAVRSLKS